LEAARQPNTADDIAQQRATVRGAQVALDAARHPHTAEDVAYARAQFAEAAQTLRIDKGQLATAAELRAPATGTILAVTIVAGQATSGASSGSSAGSSSSSSNGAMT